MTKPSAKRQRKIKPLPNPIVEMTSADSHHLIILEELDPHSKSKTYGKSMRVVSTVKGIEPNGDEVVLDHLTTDQVCLLQEILVSQTWVPKTSLFVAWQWRCTLNFNINSLVLVTRSLYVDTICLVVTREVRLDIVHIFFGGVVISMWYPLRTATHSVIT